ncbi:MAG: transporter substrate-binding domain-containing protein [Desulfobacteraceae bacterium]|nr:transporter substrate-binding domain-containing protein [Desulfobacteraceae bacterium]
MKNVVFTIAVWISFLSFCHAGEKVSLVTLEWPPYAGSEIEHKGFVTDIMRRAYEESGYTVQISIRPWARALRETETGQHDIAFPAYYSDERNKKFVLISIGVKSEICFMKLKKTKIISYVSIEELKDFTIGVVHGYVNRADFDNAGYFKKLKVYSDKANITELINGRHDLIVIDKMVANHLLKRDNIQQETGFLEPSLDSKELFAAFSRQTADLEKKITAFKHGLKMIKK